MTRDEALKLDAGPELDTFIATKLMGWQVFPYIMPVAPDWKQYYCPPDVRVHASTIKEVPKFSTDIAAAWEILERVESTNGTYMINHQPHAGKKYLVFIGMARGMDIVWQGTSVHEDSLPLAICRAALKAVMKD